MSTEQTLLLDHAFLSRVRKATLALGSAGAVFATVYGGVATGLGWTAGVAVSLLNFALLHWILVRVLRPQPLLGPKVAVALVLKLPLLLGSVFLAVGVARLPLLWFSLGFFLLFVVVVLKALGRLLMARQGLRVGDPREGAAFRLRERRRRGDLSTKGKIGAALLVVGLCLAGPELPRLVAEHEPGSWTTDLSVDLERSPVAFAADPADPHAPAGDASAGDAHGSDRHGAGTAADDAHADLGHADAAHGGGHGDHGDDHGAVKHFPNLVTYFSWTLGKLGIHDAPWLKLIETYENVVFNIIVALVLGIAAAKASAARQMIPGRLQNLVEYAVETLYEFIKGILGSEARRYIPFIGTLFFYIWGMNWLGLVPGGKSPTAYIETTLALAGCTFLYVQFTGITRLGFLGWLHHLAGSPKDPVGWAMVPLMFPLEIIGELAKPVSLSLRLFGNIMGEDTLLALFATLVAIPLFGMKVGVPLHVPFMFLAMLASTIQALVFTLLATIYFSQMLPHGHDEEH